MESVERSYGMCRDERLGGGQNIPGDLDQRPVFTVCRDTPENLCDSLAVQAALSNAPSQGASQFDRKDR